ncbi:site-specific DNA-methyltransferase [Gammaproteobacteria bacterium]|nr:site-specific DNA-methyltransferase [Gammaproteobacteria bacterium]
MRDNFIYNQDCLKTLKKMEDSSVDLVLTSPPYNMNLRIFYGKYRSRQVTKELSTKYSNFSDNMPIEDFYNFHLKVIKELIRVSNIVFYNIQIVTGSKRAFFKIIGEMNEFLKDIIVWDKTHGQPAIGKQVLNRQSELLLIFEKDYPISRQFRKTGYFDRGTLTDLWSIPRAYQKSHENGAVFPEALVEKVLKNFTKEGDLIYDPFFGTGTTGVVAKKMGRRYIGSEISKEYVKIARERIKKSKKNEYI